MATGAENQPDKNLDDFGKVVDALHDKNKLSALRTYQGDVAEFIKEKNVSVVSVAVKETERRQKREETEAVKEVTQKTQPERDKRKSNAILALISLLLLAAGGISLTLVMRVLRTDPVVPVGLEESIIPYNSSATLSVAAATDLQKALGGVAAGGGITLISISGPDGRLLRKAGDFFDFLGASLPFTLSRNLRDDWALGVMSKNGAFLPFLVFEVSDFGGAFAGMLDWEGSIESDLEFLSLSLKTDMTSLLSSTTPLLKPENFTWQDVIVKNKDTRGLVGEKGGSKIAYTFLDRNTVLVVGDISIIGDISSAYTARTVAR